FVDNEEKTSISLTSIEQTLFAAQIEQAAGRDRAAIQMTQRVRNAIDTSELGAYLKLHAMRADLIEGNSTLHAGNPAAALPLLQRALATRRALLATSSPEIADAQVALADCYLALGQRAAAQGLANEALAIHAAHAQLGEQYRGPLRDLQRRL
ncbi:MAG: tetratricopeptide repeat protein, partial [Luteimonas sp.]